MRARSVSVIIFIFTQNLIILGIVEGRPSYATATNNMCSACHVIEVEGRMEVTGYDVLMDIGTQLDGNVRGPLKTFKTPPGQIVTLSVDVLDGNDRFAVQIKDFEQGGRLNDSANKLVWSEANDPDNVWTRQEIDNPPYFTKDNGNNGGLSGAITPATYTFDLFVQSGTPFDVYELVFAVPGRRSGLGRVYQEERFYLEIICPYEIAGDLNDDCRVNFADLAIMASNWLTDCFLDPTDPACVPK